jgi:hypothetical protein
VGRGEAGAVRDEISAMLFWWLLLLSCCRGSSSCSFLITPVKREEGGGGGKEEGFSMVCVSGIPRRTCEIRDFLPSPS